jgi:hypothetical protein
MIGAPMLGDDFLERHFTAWLDRTIHPDCRESVEAGMRRYVQDHPETVQEMNWGWPEVRAVAEREGYF